MGRTSCRYEPQRQGQDKKLKGRLHTLVGERRRFGYRRLMVLLSRDPGSEGVGPDKKTSCLLGLPV